MKGIKTILGIALATTGFGGAIAVGAVSATQNNKVEQAEAATKWSGAYIKGSWDSSWTAKQLTYNSNTDRYQITVSNLAAGTQFKFTSKSDWSGTNIAYDWGGISSDKVLSTITYDGGGNDHNFVLRAAGTYTFYVDKGVIETGYDDPSYGVHIECDYSYVISHANKEYTRIHLWNSDTDAYTSWDNDPTLANIGGGQAYNVKWGNSSYSLYRIPHPLLTSYKNAILRDATSQTADFSLSNVTGPGFINMTSTTNTSAGFENTNSDNYKAAKIAFDAVSHRGAATYNNYNFAYSVCATSASDAQNIINAYDGSSSSVKNILNTVKVNVYDVSGTLSEYTKTDLQISKVVDAMRIIVAKNGGGSSSNFISISWKDNQAIIAVVLIGSIVMFTSVGAFFLLKKKKHN